MAATFIAPTTITETFCSTGDKVLPSGTSVPTMANQVDGFPQSQANTIENGGIPVKRIEMNGVFNLYSQHTLWQEVGGQYTFDTTIANAGGYNKGAILAYYNDDGTFNSFLCSTKDNNADNFITTPSVIGNSWINIIDSTLPDVNDFLDTGSVTIGGRIANNTNTIQTVMPSYNGFIPLGNIVTIPSGNYVQVGFFTTDRSSEMNYAQVKADYTDGGNGVFKPTTSFTVNSGNGYSASISQGPAFSDSGYIGYLTEIQNLCSNNTASSMSFNPDINSNASSKWILTDNNVTNNGIALNLNARPSIIGSGTLSSDTNSLAIIGDITGSSSIVYSYKDGPWLIRAVKTGIDKTTGLILSGTYIGVVPSGNSYQQLNLNTLGWINTLTGTDSFQAYGTTQNLANASTPNSSSAIGYGSNLATLSLEVYYPTGGAVNIAFSIVI